VARIAVIGEVLWDVFPDATHLGGAPLNFAVHARRLGYEVQLISAVGDDDLGRQAESRITEMGLETEMLGVSSRFETGTAHVRLGPGGQADFTIERPAAYDDVTLTDDQLKYIADWAPWDLYFGTLFASHASGRAALRRLMAAIPGARRFYDVNLRPGSDSPELVSDLMRSANVVKLNEAELESLHGYLELPAHPERFCREGAQRLGWEASCITFAERGCAVAVGLSYVESPGFRVRVADPVGAGDAFAAAFLHGLDAGWPAAKIAQFANRLGALVASRPGAIPDWSVAEIGMG
jgi:fructokinase